MLLAIGYPPRGVDWLRQHRLAVIIAMALAAWALFIGLGWLALTVLARLLT
jgi:hypothetical protein